VSVAEVVRAAAPAAAPVARRRRSSVALTLVATPLAAAAALVVALVVVAAVFSSQLAPFNPVFQDLSARLSAPLQSSRAGFHLLGTDALGRDILSRLIFGSRVSLVIGVASVAVAGVLGVALGLAAGYARGGWDDLIMRLADIQLAIPFLVLALATVAVVGPSLLNLIIVLGVTGWVQYARIVRAETLSVSSREYVEAARLLGGTPARIVVRHVLPNVMASIIVVGTLQISRMILFEASLSFLGLGVPPPTPTWGGMVADGRSYVERAWWVSTLPGLAIFIVVLAIAILGDRLRDVLDPRLQNA
jgi:peptide/nickel transport system permease protein